MFLKAGKVQALLSNTIVNVTWDMSLDMVPCHTNLLECYFSR